MSLCLRYGVELACDWFDVFPVNRVGHDTNVHIRERKSLTGISYDVDETDVFTRIMLTGEDADGNILYLPELYVDSPNIGGYVHPKWIHLPVSEAKEVAEGENYKSLTECYGKKTPLHAGLAMTAKSGVRGLFCVLTTGKTVLDERVSSRFRPSSSNRPWTKNFVQVRPSSSKPRRERKCRIRTRAYPRLDESTGEGHLIPTAKKPI